MKKLIVIFFALLFIASPVAATDYYVDATMADDSGNGESPATAKKTLQAGINLAANGDTVWVADTGTYTESIDWGAAPNGFTVKPYQADYFTVDPPGATRGFYFHNGETNAAVLEGFIITDGNSISNGGGILMEGASPTICRGKITNCSADYGGAIYGRDAGCDPKLSFILAANCSAASSGGAMRWFGNADSPEVTNCTIINSTSVSFGGINCSDADVIFKNCIVYGNTSDAGNSDEFGTANVSYSYIPAASNYTDGGNNSAADPSINSDGTLKGGSPCINTGTDPFSDGDGDKYDLWNHQVWSDTTDTPVGAWISGVEIGAYGYSGGGGSTRTRLDIKL